MDGYVGNGAIDGPDLIDTSNDSSFGSANVSNAGPSSNDLFSSLEAGSTRSNDNNVDKNKSNSNDNNNNNSNRNDNNSSNTRPLWEKILFCFSVETYKVFFNVDTADVKDRMKSVITHFNVEGHFKDEVLQRNGSGPDLYGPWWISTSLVFVVAVTSNLSMYMHSDSSADFAYDINHLAHAMTVLYSFVFILPIFLYMAFQCLSIQNFPLLDLVCLYGYSLVPFIPAALLCSIPYEFVIWIALMSASIVSLIFVLRNLIKPIMNDNNISVGNGAISGVLRHKEAPIVGCVIGCQVIFLIVLKFYFYHHHRTAHQSSGTVSDTIVDTDAGAEVDAGTYPDVDDTGIGM